MSQVEIVQIDPTMTQRLEEIAALAHEASLPPAVSPSTPDVSARGFLVSGYGVDKYREAAARGQLTAAVQGGHAASFVLTYGASDEIDPEDFGSQFIRRQFDPSAPIIKQIATGAAYVGQGHARLLYEHFAAAGTADVFAAIVKSPPNLGSEALHRKLGFHECAVFEHPDGKPRGIWRWPAARQPRPAA
jgi:predicted GNAT superfamily acetyltransferase